MSFSVWMSMFKEQESFWFPLRELHNRFGHSPTSQEDSEFRLVIDERPTSTIIIYEAQGGRINGFAIQAPSAEPALWNIIAGFLRDLPCVLYWPSTTSCACMGSLTLLPHLPDDFIETCGIPFVSTDAETIRKFVGENS